MKSNDIIKHEKSLDVAFFVMSIERRRRYVTITGMWLIQGFETTTVLTGEIDQIRIKKNRLSQWLVCKNPDAQCVRNEKWERVA